MVKIPRKVKLAIFAGSVVLDIITSYEDLGVGHSLAEGLMYCGYGLSIFFASKAIYENAPRVADSTVTALNKLAKFGREKFDPTKNP